MPDLKDFVLLILPWIMVPPLLFTIWAFIQRRKHPPTREQLEAAAVLKDSKWLPSGWAAWAFVFVYEGAYGLRRLASVPGVLKGLLLGLPVIAFAWFWYVLVREVRTGGDLERRVQGEAASSAIVMFLSFSLLMWLTDEIWSMPHHGTFSAGLGFLPLFYGLAMFTAKAKLYPTGKVQ